MAKALAGAATLGNHNLEKSFQPSFQNIKRSQTEGLGKEIDMGKGEPEP